MDSKAKILIVDDDDDCIESMRVVLENASYEVASARDENEALKVLASNVPDLLILDVMMTNLDSGFQLLWRLKRDERYRHIPVLISTSVDRELGIDFASTTGAPAQASDDADYLPVDGYLSKPVNSDELLTRLDEVLGGGGTSSA